MPLSKEQVTKLTNDRNFIGLPFEEKRKVMIRLDPDFAGLSENDQNIVMNRIDVTTPRGPSELRVAGGELQRSLLQGGGAMAGFLLTPSPEPVARVAGGALGFAAGKQAADRVDELLGLKEPAEDIPEIALSAVNDIKTGVEYELFGQSAGRAVGVTARKVLAPVARRIGTKGIELIGKAKEIGLELTPAEVTQSKTFALIESALDKIPIATNFIRNFRLGQLSVLIKQREKLIQSKAADESIEAIGFKIQNQLQSLLNKQTALLSKNKKIVADRLLKKLGGFETFEELGRSAQESIRDFSEKAFGRSDILYKKASHLIDPAVTFTPKRFSRAAGDFIEKELNAPPALRDRELIAILKDFAPRKVSKSATSQLLDQSGRPIKTPQNLTPPKFSFDELVEIRKRIGAKIRAAESGLQSQVSGTRGLATPSTGKLKQLLKILEGDLANFTRGNFRQAKDALDIANAFYRGNKLTVNSDVIKRILRSNPEAVIGTVFNKNSTTELKILKDALKGDFGLIKKGFTKKIIETKGKDLTGDIIRRNMGKLNSETLGEVYTRDELKGLLVFARQLDALDPRVLDNPLFRQVLRSGPESVVSAIVKPNNTSNIKLIRNKLGNEGVELLQRGFLAKALRTMPDGEFSQVRFFKEIGKFGDRTIKELFDKKTANELLRFRDLAVATRFAETIGGNPSGTAQSLVTIVSGKMILKNPVTGVNLLFPPAAFAKLYLNPSVRKWLTVGFKEPFNTELATQAFNRIALAASAQKD